MKKGRRQFIQKSSLGAFAASLGQNLTSLPAWAQETCQNLIQSQNPKYHVFDKTCVDSRWALKECKSLIQEFAGVPSPVYGLTLAQPAFTSEYRCYTFHRDSQTPLIRHFVQAIEAQRRRFQALYPQKSWKFEYVVLTHVANASKPVSRKEKDLLFNGAWRLTVEGQSHIMVHPEEHLLKVKNGTLWFMNSGEFAHQIIPTPTAKERFELLAVWDLAPEIANYQKQRILSGPAKYVDIRPDEKALRGQLFSQVKATKKPFIKQKDELA